MGKKMGKDNKIWVDMKMPNHFLNIISPNHVFLFGLFFTTSRNNKYWFVDNLYIDLEQTCIFI